MVTIYSPSAPSSARKLEIEPTNPATEVLRATSTRAELRCLLRHRGFVDQDGFAVFYRLLCQREPRFSHGEKRQPISGIGNPLGKLSARSRVQAITRHKFIH